ncbi:MAG: hypothetical protein IKN26_02045 [Eubacterium sp.]|nr:hypothetical protein [Eubacterium sp.]
MNFKKIFSIVLVLLIAAAMLCSCAAKSSASESTESLFTDRDINYSYDGKSTQEISLNDESITIMTNIEKAVRAFIHKTLLDKYPGETWIQEIPAKIYLNATSSVSKQLHEKGEHVDVWDCFTLSDLREIVLYGNHWSGLYESYLTIPSESKMKGGKKSKTDWMDLVDKLQKNVGRSTFSVSKDDFTKLQEIEGILPNLQNQSN